MCAIMKYFCIRGLFLLVIAGEVKNQNTLPPFSLIELSSPNTIQVQGYNNLYGNNLYGTNPSLTDLKNFNTFIDMERLVVPGTLNKFYFCTVLPTNAACVIHLHVWRLSSNFMTLAWDKKISITSAGTKYYEVNVLTDGFIMTANDRIGWSIESGSCQMCSSNLTSHSSYWTQVPATYTYQPTISTPSSSQLIISEFAISVLIQPGFSGNSGMPGFTGYNGLPGPPGIPGYRGPTGFVGPPGNPGPPGTNGSNGGPGQNGFTGATGYTGFTGSTGFTGPTGFLGATGFTGDTGNGGFPGPQGQYGIPGSVGDMGAMGSTGFTGLPGSTGIVGPNGIPGIAINAILGNTGYTGAIGSKGATGSKGPPGENIFNFITGPQGHPGHLGRTGVTGPPGMVGYPGNVYISDNSSDLRTCYLPITNEFEKLTGFSNYPICPGKPRTPVILAKGENVKDGTLILKCQSMTLDSITGGNPTIFWSLDNVPLKQVGSSTQTITGEFESKRYSIKENTLTINSLDENDNKRWINCFVSLEGYWSPSDSSDNYVIYLSPGIGCISNPCGSEGQCFDLSNYDYNCTCYEGYENNGPKRCVDIDECKKNMINCPKNSNCANFNGSYRCTCAQNYEGLNCDQEIPSNRITKITSIFPALSILAGGLEFCLSGEGLGHPRFANMVSDIQGLPTFIAESSDNKKNEAICFIAPEIERIFVAIPFKVILVYNNNKNVTTNQTFSFINNPEIVGIYEANPLDQSVVTFYGTGFNGVNQIELIIDFRRYIKEDKNLTFTSETVADTNRICNISDESKFKCPLPNLSTPLVNGTEIIIINKTYNLQQAVNTASLGRKIFVYRDFRIRFNRHSFEIIANKFFNSGSKPLLSYKFSIEKYKEIIKYNLNGFETLKIRGTDLNINLAIDDYNITVGGNKCIIQNLLTNLIECRPKVLISQYQNTFCSPNYHFKAIVKGEEFFIGCVDTTDDSYNANSLGLPIGLAVGFFILALIVFMIVIYFACVKKTPSNKQKNSNKNKIKKNKTDETANLEDFYVESNQSYSEYNGVERVGGLEYVNSTELG